MEIAITGYQMVVGLGAIGLAIYISILILRKYFNQKLKIDHEGSWSSRTKYRVYDVFRHSSVFFQAGIICALLLSLLAFNYTQYNRVHNVPVFEPDDWIDPTTPPITYPEPKSIPQPPKSTNDNQIIEIVEDKAPKPVFVEDVVTVDAEIDPKTTNTNVVTSPVPPSLPTPPVLPPIKEVDDKAIIVAQWMPMMCSSCDNKEITRKEKNACATKEMMLFVQKQLKYPLMAREVGIEGVCPVRFVVRSDGRIDNIELLRDIGAGCGKEALRVTRTLKDQCWSPGRQNGRKVSVQMVLPIRFKLE